MSIEIQYPEYWKDYELLDCGDFEKLERFGEYITIRPEPQAVWPKVWSPKEWKEKAHVRFTAKSSSSGTWEKYKKMPDNWQLKYPIHASSKSATLSFKLALTSFKHVGIFPEQAVNWEKIYTSLSSMKQPKFLNLFAYTGGASIAAKAAGADVTHVDSIKQVVSWAKDNMTLSRLDNIRWIIDDALKFVKKEVRRGNVYQGIILDPPAYGHGPNGEKWKLEEQIHELVTEVLSVLDPKEHLLILNAYSLGFSALIIENLLKDYAKKHRSDLKVGELYLPAKSGVKLPLGVWGNLKK
jgi:23S rRNA (cytosine1962-C5)-methyltransferase